MYRSRFRSSGRLIAAGDVCDDSISKYLANPQLYLQIRPPSSSFANTRFETFLCPDFFTSACDMKDLTYIVDLHKSEPSRINSIQQEYFEDTYVAVQRSLAAFPLRSAASFVKSTEFYQQHCWRLAALIYNNTALRTWHVSSSWAKVLVDDLISTLQESDAITTWSSFLDVLLWTLFVGSRGAESERGWFVLELRRVVRLLGLQTLDQVESILKCFLYRDIVFYEPLCELWEQIHP